MHAQSLKHIQLFATAWTVVHQAPLSMRFSMQEYWSGLLFSPLGDLPDTGLLWPLHWKADSLPLRHLGIPQKKEEALEDPHFLAPLGGNCFSLSLLAE